MTIGQPIHTMPVTHQARYRCYVRPALDFGYHGIAWADVVDGIDDVVCRRRGCYVFGRFDDTDRDCPTVRQEERLWNDIRGMIGELCRVLPLVDHHEDARPGVRPHLRIVEPSDSGTVVPMGIVRPQRNALTGGVAHCFTGSREELMAYVQMDLAIGITGWICDERRGSHLLPLMSEIPADRLLLETDGPYLLPRDLPSKPESRRNEPAYLPHIAATVARARGTAVEELARSSSEATRRLFRLPSLIG